MKEDMLALEQNRTWDLAIFSPRKKAVGCRWLYTVKLNTDGLLLHLKVVWLPKDILKYGAVCFAVKGVKVRNS